MVLDANTEIGYFLVMPLTSKNDIQEGKIYKVDPENLTIFPPDVDMNQALADPDFFDKTIHGKNIHYYDEKNILQALDDTLQDVSSRLERYDN